MSSPRCGSKRRLSAGEDQSAHSKRPVLQDEDDGDLASILLQIQQQEDSEALARTLHTQWSSDSLTAPDPPQTEDHTSSDGIAGEDDEAMARRLARQWAEEDGDESMESDAPPALRTRELSVGPSTTAVARPHNGEEEAPDMPPDEQLVQYRDFFVGPKLCVECGNKMESPRGHVCRPYPCSMVWISQGEAIGYVLCKCTTSDARSSTPYIVLVMPYGALPWLP
jgi:hypothetical protein